MGLEYSNRKKIDSSFYNCKSTAIGGYLKCSKKSIQIALKRVLRRSGQVFDKTFVERICVLAYRFCERKGNEVCMQLRNG